MDEERNRLHDSLRDELFKRQLSNSENLDRAILMLSSAGLGLSLVFVKDLVPLAKADCILYFSWFLFGFAILSTLVSFFVSQQGIKKQLEMNRQYYLEGKKEVLNQKNRWASTTEYLSYVSASTYAIAAFFLVLFIALNLNKINIMED
ncbi:MAG: hypothetical protein OXM61_03485 [Candidatus Poribacteria bacterium]|nr:hypothetical protein [Candidatus Poribacteria bacterium]